MTQGKRINAEFFNHRSKGVAMQEEMHREFFGSGGLS
jgi:hypothetical protein